MNSLTATQTKALQAAHDTGCAVDVSKLYKNGAHLRMLNKMVVAGLLTEAYAITTKGLEMLDIPAPVAEPALPDVGPYRIRSTGVQDGKTWARFHGQPIASRELAVAKLADLTARTARVYGKQPAPFTFELTA